MRRNSNPGMGASSVNGKVNMAATTDNPRHHFSNSAERYQGSHGSAYQPGHPTITQKCSARPAVNHSQKVNRLDHHANCGTSGKAHAYPGRRK
jgi:hypothetical protein